MSWGPGLGQAGWVFVGKKKKDLSGNIVSLCQAERTGSAAQFKTLCDSDLQAVLRGMDLCVSLLPWHCFYCDNTRV